MEAGHPNRSKLDATLVEVQQVAGEVNDRVKAEERQRRIFDVYNFIPVAGRNTRQRPFFCIQRLR